MNSKKGNPVQIFEGISDGTSGEALFCFSGGTYGENPVKLLKKLLSRKITGEINWEKTGELSDGIAGGIFMENCGRIP